MFDTHLHTSFSHDARMTSEEAAAAARDLGIGIIITEHLDLEYPDTPEAFVFDIGEYFAALEAARQQGRCLLGVELGLRVECSRQNRQAISGWPFDEIIGSIHVVDGIDIYSPQFTRQRAKQAAYGRYLATMLACVEDFADFDTLGHVDYICRYAQYADPELRLTDFYDEWTAICRALIKNDKVLELNTRRLDQRQAVEALRPLYRRYRELGGRYVTIGSDAHRPDNVGKYLLPAWEFAQELGLVPVYYKQRKMYIDKR